MTWFHWLLIVLLALEPVLKIAFIGAARREITKSDAVWALITNALMIWGVVHYA